jgi:hypothetical protein
MYAIGVAFSLLIFWNLLRLVEATRGGIASIPRVAAPTGHGTYDGVLKKGTGIVGRFDLKPALNRRK